MKKVQKDILFTSKHNGETKKLTVDKMNKEKLPTAEEFLRRKCKKTNNNLYPCKTYMGQGSLLADNVSPKMLIEFTKLHVEAQKKAILENAKVTYVSQWSDDQCVDRNSIINAYPLTNIK